MKERSTAADTQRVISWLRPHPILLEVEVRDREHAIEIIAQALGRAHGLDAPIVQRALWRRELAGSTAVGDCLAIPHAQVNNIAQPLTLYMRTRHGIACKAGDGRPVFDFLAILVPANGHRDDHLRLLALVARLFTSPTFRMQLAAATNAASATEAFRTGVAAALGNKHPGD